MVVELTDEGAEVVDAASAEQAGFGVVGIQLDRGRGRGGHPEVVHGVRLTADTNSAADPVSVLDTALEQLSRVVLSRVVTCADSGGGTKALLTRITGLGSYHVHERPHEARGVGRPERFRLVDRIGNALCSPDSG